MKSALSLSFLLVLAGAPLVQADLVGWWPLDGTFDDQGGNQLTGDVLGEPTFEQSSWLRFNEGDADGVQIPANDRLDAEIFTLAYRINQDGKIQSNAGLERLTSREGDSFETGIGDASAVGGTTAQSGTTLSYYQGTWNVTNVEIPAEGWVHVAWQNTQEEMKLYVDGKLEFSGPPVDPGRAFGYMNIGIRHNEVEGYEGLIDDVFLWDDAENPLTEADIAVIASSGIAAVLGLDTDTDKDGLPNGWEEQHELDPADDGSGSEANGAQGDPDSDGLTNAQEFELGTLPREADTDGDSLSDGDEVTLGTNPRSPDTDRDGINDGHELAMKIDPTKADTDGDGFLDGFELQSESDPVDAQSVPGLDDTLILHLSFDGDLSDQSGKGHDGEALGEPAFEDDIPLSVGAGQAIRFHEGDSDGLTIAASDPLDADVFTLAYFVNQDGASQGNAGLERLTSRGGDQFETAIGDANAIGGSEPGTLSYYSPKTGWTMTGVIVPETGWAHVAWRNQGTGAEDMELFLDGVLVYTGAGVTTGTGGLMNIGIRHNGVEGYEGLMDELRLYSVALSDDGIAALPNQSTGGIQIVDARQEADGTFSLAWTSSPGQFFDIEKSTTLEPGEWSTVARQMPAAQQGEETRLMLDTLAVEDQSYFRVGRVGPPALFSDDFETGGEGWTTGIVGQFPEGVTQWELGTPTGGPGMAHSGSGAYATDLDANYQSNTGIYLRSPVLDFAGRGRTRLSFSYALDVPDTEGGRLNVRDTEGNLLQSLKIYDGNAASQAWIEEIVTLPVLEESAMIEFEFLSDDKDGDNGAGWFIDDVRIE